MKQIEIQHKTFRLKNDDRTFFCTEAKVDYNLNVLGISYVPVRNNMLPSDWEDSSVWLHLPNARLKDVIVIEDAQGLSGAYIPASKLEHGFSLKVNTPDSMDESTAEALKQLKNAVGDVAEFVAERLHYSLQELSECLALEQIDAVALAIYNVEARNQGLIVGDQTGIGKGRVASAFIRYGVVNGYKPIFFTEKPGLFSDIYRDLCDLHCETYRPFIINKDGGNVMNADGWDVFKHNQEDYKNAIATGELPDKYDYICCTYSQVSSSSESSKEKLNFIAKMAKGNIIVLDEAHNAGGEVKINKDDEIKGGFTAFFFQTEILCKCKGVLYLSATYAKQPKNMPIYALNTCISDLDERGLRKDSLQEHTPEHIAKSLNDISRYFISVPAQEIISSSMSRFGQFIRRERETKGMKVNYYTLDDSLASLEEGFQNLKDEHWAIYKNITNIYDRIRDFQERYFLPYLKDIAEDLARQGKRGQKPPTVASASLFSSLFHLTNNILLSIKALPVAERAIKHIKEGKKVVIALADTNESVLKNRKDAGRKDSDNEGDDAMMSIEVSEGQTINGDYTFTFDNIFRNLFYYQIRKGRKVEMKVPIDIEDLGADAVEEYNAILDLFRTTTSGLCFSPIDVIKERIERENYSVAECTGRSLCLKFQNGDYRRSTIQKVEKYSAQQGRHVSLCYKKFNDNEVDVLIINQSGSTGKSAHATNKGTKLKPEEVKQRVMIIAQAELDVNTEVQKRGRINRTGQFEHIPPMYEYIFSAIPCEKRFMMMLKAKLKSLDANTTANQKQSNDSVLRTDDFFNKYGDFIVEGILNGDDDLNHRLNDPLAKEQDPVNRYRKKQKVDAMALTCFGRMQVISPEEQEKYYNLVLSRYNEMVEQLKMNDEFDLEIKNADFQAKKISENVLTINNNDGTRSELVGNSFITKYSIKSQTKFTSLKDLTDMVNRNIQSGLGATDEILKRLKTDYDTIVNGEDERHKERLKSEIEEQERKIENINRTIEDLVEDGGSQDSIDRQREKRKVAVEKLKALKSGKDEEFDEKMARRKEQYDILRGLIDKMRVGEFFEYESNIFCVTQISISNGNGDINIFSAPSNILVSFITTDPLNLRGVSHNFAQNGCEFMTKLSEKKSSARAYDAYVKNDTRREEVNIITGNIVKYLGQEGKIVITRYTLEDGTMENGIVVKPVLKNGVLEYPDWARYTQVPMTEKTIKPVMLSLTNESMCPLTSNQFVGGLRLRGQRRGDDMGFYIDADRGYGEFLSQPDVYSCFAYEPRWNGTYNTEVSNIKKFLSILTREEYGFMVQVHISNLSAYSDAIGLEKYKPADWQKLSYNKSSVKKNYCGNLLRAEIAVRRVNSMVDEANKGKKPSSKSEGMKPSNEEQPSEQPIFVHDYSAKAWAVTGGGKREWDILRGEGAKFNKNLSVGKGWVLPKAKFTKAEILKLVA